MKIVSNETFQKFLKFERLNSCYLSEISRKDKFIDELCDQKRALEEKLFNLTVEKEGLYYVEAQPSKVPFQPIQFGVMKRNPRGAHLIAAYPTRTQATNAIKELQKGISK